MPVRVSYKKQVLLLLMFLVVVMAVAEVSLRTYDYFNPRCDFMITPLAENVDTEFKQEVCETWKRTLVYIDPVTGSTRRVSVQQIPAR